MTRQDISQYKPLTEDEANDAYYLSPPPGIRMRMIADWHRGQGLLKAAMAMTSYLRSTDEGAADIDAFKDLDAAIKDFTEWDGS